MTRCDNDPEVRLVNDFETRKLAQYISCASVRARFNRREDFVIGLEDGSGLFVIIIRDTEDTILDDMFSVCNRSNLSLNE